MATDGQCRVETSTLRLRMTTRQCMGSFLRRAPFQVPKYGSTGTLIKRIRKRTLVFRTTHMQTHAEESVLRAIANFRCLGSHSFCVPRKNMPEMRHSASGVEMSMKTPDSVSIFVAGFSIKQHTSPSSGLPETGNYSTTSPAYCWGQMCWIGLQGSVSIRSLCAKPSN